MYFLSARDPSTLKFTESQAALTIQLMGSSNNALATALSFSWVPYFCKIWQSCADIYMHLQKCVVDVFFKDILVSDLSVGDDFAMWHPGVIKVLKAQTKTGEKKKKKEWGSVRRMTEVVH